MNQLVLREFLKNPGKIVPNNKLNEKGELEVPKDLLEKYQFVFAVVRDDER